MKIARILAPVHTLGPGNRVCIWTQGCNKGCAGCIAPELQPVGEADVAEELLAQLVKDAARRNQCTGLTISGGDPFEQADALLKFLSRVRESFKDILVYTGFTMGELQSGITGEVGINVLKYIDVLIDGRYIASLNRPKCVLRGSENQQIYYLNPALKSRYKRYMKKGRILETFQHKENIIIVGIQNEGE